VCERIGRCVLALGCCASAGGRWVRADGWPWSGSGCCCIGGGFWAAEGWFGGCAQTGSAIATSAARLIAPTTFFMGSAPELADFAINARN
jgi:hypothetical protein